MFRELNTGLIHFSAGFTQSLEGFCLVIRSDGLLCCGEFLNNQLSGKAIIWKNELEFFIGNFQRGQLQFIDIAQKNVREYFKWVSLQCKSFKFIKHQSNNSNYFGTIETKRKPQGLGIVIHEDGKLNYGQYNEGKMNGYCQLQLKNNDRYTGMCVDGKIQGWGVFYQAEQRQTYLGRFEKGECMHILETSTGQPTKNQINKLEVMVLQKDLPELFLQNYETFMSKLQKPIQNVQSIYMQTTPEKKSQSFVMNIKKFEFNSTSSSHFNKTQSKTFESCQPYEIQNNDHTNRNEILSSSSSIMNTEQEEGICRFQQIMNNLQTLKQNSFIPPNATDLDQSQMAAINQDFSHQSNLPGLEVQVSRILNKTQDLSDKKKKVSENYLDNKDYKNISVNNNIKQLQFSQTMQCFQTTKQTRFTLKESNQKDQKLKGVDKSSQCYSINPQKRANTKHNTINDIKKPQQIISKHQQTNSSISYRKVSPQVIDKQYQKTFQRLPHFPFSEKQTKPAFITIRNIAPQLRTYQQWMSKSVVLTKF